MKLTVAKKHFLNSLKQDLGRSAGTIEKYDRAVTLFLQFVKVVNAGDVSDMQVTSFNDHLRKLKINPHPNITTVMKPQTINLYLVAVRSFLKYLHTKNLSRVSPSLLKLETLPTLVPQTISGENAKKLLAAPNPKTLVGQRDRLILELLLKGGFLVSEICAMNRDDIDFGAAVISVRAKSNQIRDIQIKPTLVKSVAKYLNKRSDKNPALFIQYGKNVHNAKDLRLSVRAVQRLVKSSALKAGLPNTVTPQVLRHTFALGLVNSGVDLNVTQGLLGHVKLETTKKFAQITGAQTL